MRDCIVISARFVGLGMKRLRAANRFISAVAVEVGVGALDGEYQLWVFHVER